MTTTPTRGVQIAIAAASAAVIAAGVVIDGWPTFTVLALYWLENVVIGVFTLLRMLAAGARTERYGESLFGGAFFTVHYGLFCLVHGVFVATLFGGIQPGSGGLFDPVLLMIGRVAGDRIGVLVVVAMIAAAATDALRWWARFNGDERALKSIMFEPYGRIIVLHVVLIGGGFLMQLLGAPALAALLLVAFKLVYDLRRLRPSDRAAADGETADSSSV